MSMLFILAAAGVSFLLLILAVVLVKRVKCCRTLEEDVEEVSEQQQYDMSPSEIHEFHDFEKTIGGEIYAENQQKINNPTNAKVGTPNPGFEKFRRIPTLASEKSHRKLKQRSIDSIVMQPSSVGDYQQQHRRRAKSIGSIGDQATRLTEDESREGSHDTFNSNTTPIGPMTDRSRKVSTISENDGFSRPISTRTAKSFVMSHFSNSMDTTISYMTKNSNFHEADTFSIANDEAEL